MAVQVVSTIHIHRFYAIYIHISRKILIKRSWTVILVRQFRLKCYPLKNCLFLNPILCNVWKSTIQTNKKFQMVFCLTFVLRSLFFVITFKNMAEPRFLGETLVRAKFYNTKKLRKKAFETIVNSTADFCFFSTTWSRSFCWSLVGLSSIKTPTLMLDLTRFTVELTKGLL